MAEAIGAAGAVAGLLESAIRLIKRLRKAHERQQRLAGILDKQALEVETAKAVIQTVEKEDALQTAVIAAELAKLRAVGERLVNCLKTLDPGGKGKTRQLAHQLVHGTHAEETLADIMTDLDRAKTDLGLRVQLATVGLTRMLHDSVLANAQVIQRIDCGLAGVPREGHGLKLAGLLEDAVPQADDEGDGLASLNKADVASLSGETIVDAEAGATIDDVEFDRTIVGNMARESAIQLLGPVGRDLWEGARVRIENMTASGDAVQIAYPADFETFKYILEHRERMAGIKAK